MIETPHRSIDAAQARFLRRILKVPAAYISRVSHKEIRRRSSIFRFSTFIFRAQLRWLGHILRIPPDDPLRRVLFEPHSPLRPARPPGSAVSNARESGVLLGIGRNLFFTKFTS